MRKAQKRRIIEPGECSVSVTPVMRISKRSRLISSSGLPTYYDCGDCVCVCEFCGALFWYMERLRNRYETNHPKYNHCCKGGSVVLPLPLTPPFEISKLYEDIHFFTDIRGYNSMFSMTSFGAVVDKEINNGRGPYVFKVSGQVYHWIGSLCPDDSKGPRFLQLYVVDTANEVSNRLKAFHDPGKKDLDAGIVRVLMESLSNHNEYVKTFKTAKEMAEVMNLDCYAVRLYNNIPDRRYGSPAPGTLGCIVNGDDSNSANYDIIVHSKSGRPQRVSKLHPSYMPLQYPLLFPFGEDGWCPRLKLRGDAAARIRNLTVNMYYSYQIHGRQDIYSLILNSGRLFQQYLVDAYTCIEADRLQFILNNQEHLRSDYLSGLYDALSKGDRENKFVGKRVFLPASFIGGPRYMYSHYQDALSICRVYGNPQYFITFTCNVKWPEITRYMETYSQRDVHSRADVIARVFEMKVKAFISFLKEDKTFGEVEAHFAELPDPVLEVSLYQTVTTCMIHGPCGPLNYKAPCMKDGKCSKHFPKPFHDATSFDKEGYAHYKRNSNTHHIMQSGTIIDNGYLVPYNKRLCSRFNAHINVEYCGWNMMIKYLFKYISKAVERVRFVVQKSEVTVTGTSDSQVALVDEVHNFLDARYICPHEAAWRILNFFIHRRHPPVMTLPVHLLNMQHVVFKESGRVEDVLRILHFAKTPLLGWFDNNITDPKGRDLTYIDYPNRYTWDPQFKKWEERVLESSKTIGRLVFVHPSSGELFYFRMLLCHQMGYMEWLTAFVEASLWATSSQLRSLFCHLLLFCEVSNPQLLWENAWRKMMDDYMLKLKIDFPDKVYHIADDVVQQQLLFELENMLRSSTPSKSLGDFHLPMPNPAAVAILQNRLLLEESSYDKESLHQQHSQMVLQLNEDQMYVYKTVVESEQNKKQVLLFVYGHGGIGKTFLWTTLLAYFRSIGKIVLVVAASRIADVLDCENRPFGGISVLLGGDFRQTLPVSPKSTRTHIIALTLPNSYLWSCFKICKLHQNMRLTASETDVTNGLSISAFAEWLLNIGNGTLGIPATDDPHSTSWVQIPDSLLIPQDSDPLKTLILFVYGNDLLHNPSPSDLSVRAIVCPTNETADALNTRVLEMMTTQERVYKSTDTMQPNGKYTLELEGLYPTEYLNQLTFAGIPAHALRLKVKAPVMLLRNINQREGLCNGTRLIVSQLLPTVVEAIIITGTCIGKRVYIPRIKFIHKPPDLPFAFERKQFPIKICYAMTINKSQGQSLKKIGIYLPQPVFTHGQLYLTIMSIMTNISDLKYACEGGPLQVRILRKWKSDYRRYETWYLAVDKYGDAIQILGQRSNQGYIELVLHIHNCYTISEYTCPYLAEYQKILENEIYIDVGLASVIVPFPDTITIPTTWFRFVSKTDLIDLGENPAYYPDFIGVLKKIRNCTKADREEFVLVVLADESGDEIAISLWKECINVPEKFKREQLAPPPATTIVAVTNIKTSIIAGTLRFGSSPATHVYVNPPIQETTLLIDRFTGPTPPTLTLSGPLITVHELINKNHNDLLDKTFCVKGVLSKITFKDYWFQVLCPTCKDPIFRKGNYWFCSTHGKTELPTFLYKIVIDLTDPTGSISALMTDASARKLIGSPPEKIITDDHVTTPVSPIQLPQSSNVEINPNLETTSTTSETPHAARKLSYDTTAESAPKKQQKRGCRVQ
ncbi:hypothetical protein Lser_V15G39993 [Lactuca serriola]